MVMKYALREHDIMKEKAAREAPARQGATVAEPRQLMPQPSVRDQPGALHSGDGRSLEPLGMLETTRSVGSACRWPGAGFWFGGSSELAGEKEACAWSTGHFDASAFLLLFAPPWSTGHLPLDLVALAAVTAAACLVNSARASGLTGQVEADAGAWLDCILLYKVRRSPSAARRPPLSRSPFVSWAL